MIKLPAVLGFTALTFFSWGTYGILLHKGQDLMQHAMLKPFVFVGVAYFIIAVLFPGAMLTKNGEKGHWSFIGTVMSFIAGAVGALGALGIILALNFGGKPIFVMPFVFGLAPVVNTLVTATINRTFNQIKFLFVVGLALVILGAVGVLISKGSPEKTKAAATSTAQSAEPTFARGPIQLVAFQSEPGTAAATSSTPTDSATAASKAKEELNSTTATIFSMVMAAFCWGAYGPVLHIGQMRMGGSRLRPFCCVGLAYFFIAVAIPLILIQTGLDRGQWDFWGALWSTGAGALGALGALGIIYAFNFGGKPVFVMPLVFGFAPIINTVVSMSVAGTLSQISPLFVGALATTIAGAVMVLVFQPSSKPHAKQAGSAASANGPKKQPKVEPVVPASSTTKADIAASTSVSSTNTPAATEPHAVHSSPIALQDLPVSEPDSAVQTGRPDEPTA